MGYVEAHSTWNNKLLHFFLFFMRKNRQNPEELTRRINHPLFRNRNWFRYWLSYKLVIFNSIFNIFILYFWCPDDFIINFPMCQIWAKLSATINCYINFSNSYIVPRLNWEILSRTVRISYNDVKERRLGAVLSFNSCNPSFIVPRFHAAICSYRILKLRVTPNDSRITWNRLSSCLLLNMNRMWLWDMTVPRHWQTTVREANIYLISRLTRFSG